jgi:hypothetical protein
MSFKKWTKNFIFTKNSWLITTTTLTLSHPLNNLMSIGRLPCKRDGNSQSTGKPLDVLSNDHKYVMDHYPIADALPVPKDDDKNDQECSEMEQQPEKKKKKFGDQLDCWDR